MYHDSEGAFSEAEFRRGEYGVTISGIYAPRQTSRRDCDSPDF